MTRKITTLLCAAALFVTIPAAADDVVSARGFDAGQVHQYSDFDSVNQFNGNLGVSVPIGGTYKTNGSLQYAFVLRYNSQLWNLRTWGHGTNIDPAGPTHGSWRGEGSFMEAYPASQFNAGLGWHLSVSGRLVGRQGRPFVGGGTRPDYIDANGGAHPFGPEPHAVGDLGAVTSTYFSNDSSYLRLRVVGEHYIVDRPDGVQERFKCISACGTEQALWDLDQMSDPYGHILYVVRGTEPTSNAHSWFWEYREAVGTVPHPDHTTASLTFIRSHTVQYVRDNKLTWRYRINSVTVSSAAGIPALYQFTYDENAGIIRPPANSYGGRDMVFPVNGNTAPENRIRMPLLLSVTLPSMLNSEGGQWSFSYVIEPTAPDYPNAISFLSWTNNTGQTFSWETTHYSGLLESVTVPTGGKVSYKYGTRGFSKRFCDTTLPAHRGNFGYIGVGIKERQLRKANGAADGRPWRYHGQAYNHLSGSCQIREFIGTTIDPMGNATANFFSVFFDGDDNPGGIWKRAEYGLPISKFESAGTNLYLSKRVFQCSAQQLTHFDGAAPADAFRKLHTRWLKAGETLSCGEPVRETYGSWEWTLGECRADSPECGRFNERLRAERVVYKDDTNSFTETTFEEFDGLGHYRIARTGGNFFDRNFANGGPGGDERVSLTNYNPGFVYAGPGAGFTATGGKDLKTMPWVLGNYDLTVVSQGPNGQVGAGSLSASSVLYQFNAQTGFLERKRVATKSAACGRDASKRAQCFNSTVLDGSDVVTDYGRTQSGTVATVQERIFGGDGAALPINDPSVPPPGNPAYIKQHVYESGGLKSSSFRACTGELILTIEDNDVDVATGLVTKSRDSAGLATTYAYDHLRRFLTIDPPGSEAPTSFQYFTSAGSSPARVVMETKDGSTVLRQAEVQFDHLGRVGVERQTYAIGTQPASWAWASRTHSYHPNGWKDSESTMGEDGRAPKGFTTYRDYDPFGRPGRINPPDAAQNHYVTLSYAGERSIVETTHGGALKSGDRSVVSRKYDRFGNLVAVNEESLEGANDEARTRYDYDLFDRLVRVAAPNDQIRTFTYDMRGFLTAETHPEIHATGIRYTNHDAAGNPGRRLYSGPNEPSSPHDLKFIYDGAGRLSDIIEIATARTLKAFRYHPQGPSAPAASAGKLKSSLRENWVRNPAELDKPRINVPVTHEFRYEPSTGRVAGRKTTAGGWTFDVGYTWNKLGNAASIEYPRLKTCDTCAVLAGSARNIQMNYVQGTLVRVPGFASSITYHPNGSVAQVIHPNTPGNATNDTRDIVAPDANNLQRPASITTRFRDGSTWFVDYTYDGAGNVSKAGTQTFLYDKVNRLAQASLSATTHNYRYDPNGNLIQYNATLLGIDPGTNRLLAPAAAYDRAGNVLRWTDPRRPALTSTFEWDAASMLVQHSDARQGKIFVYDASDERLAIFDYVADDPDIRETWTARGLNNEVLRDFKRRRTKQGATVSWKWRDAIYRSGALLAEASGTDTVQSEVRHLHVDHLGSVRRVSDASGLPVEQREFFPFGQEIAEKPSETRLRFAQHERDDNGATDPFGDVDFMHARFYNPLLGRFLSVDPVLGNPAQPQTWNRYPYARNNPLSIIDRTGKYGEPVHRDLTAMLARLVGFDDATAQAIGDADQGVDDTWATNPFRSREARVLYHFTTESQQEVLWETFLDSSSPKDLGVYLHAQQDSWSHSGFGPRWGHFFAGKGPDQPHRGPYHLLRASDETYRDLSAAAEHLGIPITNRVPWSEISPLVLEYAKARTDKDREAVLEKMRSLDGRYPR